MLNNFPQFLSQLGYRIQNYGYLLANPSYAKVRAGKGCAELYRLLNKDWFPKNEIQLVIDVGANEGKFIITSLALMPEVAVYAFEPNLSLAEKLSSHKWNSEKIKIFPVALGSKQNNLPINITKFSPASSFLEPSDQLAIEFPETEIDNIVIVKVDRIDDLINSLDTMHESILLKLDVQGFELEVLQGATGILDRIPIIVCEVNFAALYEKQPSLEAILSFLSKYGYQLVDIGDPVRSRTTKEVLYADVAFKKETF
ncbi:FkbM family methyltransferase [Trichocoleus sp. FACHB-591]|uniref:FkbM family methyltransferase n=1 Tax=Trichocoleus sp. FACHB-591 TaxID=2692872 RepID=UPI0016873EF9|nr:FkbM family methyltransferase [Trichocoleus sp. FACHB-591]MBD2093914.1 FkbM family methyltransferase [Trichocoleus sp. FACHB-591]